MTKWKRVSVVVSNYNGCKLNLLEESLTSILGNNYPNLEVILVDNASTDTSVAMAKKKFSKYSNFKIIQNPVNMYSQGLNLGILNLTGDYVAFFNNDVIANNGYFQKFVKFLDKDSNIALAQGKLLSYFDHKIIDSVGETIDSFGTPITIGAGAYAKGHFDKTVEVLSVSGSCSILRKSAVTDIGYFGDSYGIGYEDLDLALRAWLHGYRVVYYPKVTAFHKRGATDLSAMVRIKVRWHFNKNRLMTLIKNYPWGFLLRNLPITLAIYMVAGLWEMILKRRVRLGLTRFTAIGWIVINLPKILAERNQIQRKIKKQNILKIQKLLFVKSFSKSLLSFIQTK